MSVYFIYLRCVSEPVHRGALSDGARHSFDRKGMVVVSGQSISTERALELAIEAGAEDVRETEDEEEQRLLQVSCKEASRTVRYVFLLKYTRALNCGRFLSVLSCKESLSL